MSINKIQNRNSSKLLSRRDGESPSRIQLPEESTNISVSKTTVISSPKTSINLGESNDNKRKAPSFFEPLDEEGERFLKERMRLPSIDFNTMPTKYYINPHPTESIMSFSDNSISDRWDYSDEEADELECARDSLTWRQARKCQGREVVCDVPEKPIVGVYPRTLQMQKERQARRVLEEEYSRAEIISKLEKEMVSLFNLKRQYKRTLVGDGCTRARSTLPPLVGDDKLTRYRDSIISRIKRKKLEDELKRKKQVERKIAIVRTLLNEQKQKEKYLERESKKDKQLINIKPKKLKQDDYTPSRAEAEETLHSVEDRESTDETISTKEIADDGIDLVEDTPGSLNRYPQDEVQNRHSEQPTPRFSERKSSKSKSSRKKKSLQVSAKQRGKENKTTKRKVAEETEDAPAICEPQAELPATQMADLSLWFENWRENDVEQNRWKHEFEDRQLQVEKEVALKPPMLVFKNVVAGGRTQQQVLVTNMGQTALQCRVVGVQQPPLWENTPNFQSSAIQAVLCGTSKVRTGQSWSLMVTLDPPEGVEDGSAEVLMLCCRGEVRTRLSLGIQVVTPRAEPTLSTGMIRFGPQMFWCRGPITKHIEISNPGSLNCQVYWTEVVERCSPLENDSKKSNGKDESEETGEDQETKSIRILVRDMVKTAFNNVFRTFRIEAWQPLTLPPTSTVSLAVKFLPSMSQDLGEVFTKYRFNFEGETLENETQDLVICGKVKRSPFRLDNDVVDMKLSYTGGTVQQGRLVVRSAARHACRVVARVPRSLAEVVSVVPRSTMVAASGYVALAVRIILGWDFLDKTCRYLDAACGLLMFPIAVWVIDAGVPGAPPLEATVVASVASPCPITLTPSDVDLGTVTTLETVEAEVALKNHCPRTFTYAFIGLPPSVMIEPGGGSGCILPLETVKLKLFFSPRAKNLGVDCTQPGYEGEVNFTLRCFTTVSLASPIQRQDPLKGRLTKQDLLNNKSRISSKYTVSMHNSQLASNKASRTGNLHLSIEEGIKNERTRKVNFLENNTKIVLEESFLNENVFDEEEMYGEELEDNFLTISEVKEEESELDAEDLWDFYSNFQFDKCYKDTRNEAKPVRGEKEIGENEDNTIEENSELTKKTSDQKSEFGMEGNTDQVKSDIEVHDALEQANISTNGNVEEMDHSKIGVVNESLENISFDKDDTDSDSRDSGSPKGSQQVQDSQDVYQLPETSQRFATVSVRAYVVDPLVELSSQTVVLPPTPCTSYSVAHLYLRSRAQKTCAIHDKNTKFNTRFELRSPSKDLVIEPRRGHLTYKQNQKISLIYNPKLSKKDIQDKAFQMKILNLKWQRIEELLNEYNKQKEKRQPKHKSTEENADEQSEKGGMPNVEQSQTNTGKSKKSKGSVKSFKTKKTKVSLKGKSAKGSLKGSKLNKKISGPLPEVVIDPDQVQISEEDLKAAEMSLLKYLESYNETLTIICLLETAMADGNRRQESLRCDVLCSVVAPAIFLNTPACLDFGPVAVGTWSRMEATITSLSFFDVLVRLSTLNPVGPFMCPAHLEYPFWRQGELELPPEHILTVPIRFQPTGPGEVVEAFEVISDSTVLHLQARGRGVPPSFSFLPDREVFMVTSAAGKKADITISITNNCEASLKFRISQDYIKEGHTLPTPKTEENSPSSPKKKKETKKDNEFTMLTEELEKCLENDYIHVEAAEFPEPIFKLLTDDIFTILSGETKQIVIRFNLPITKQQQAENATKSPRPEKGSIKDSKNVKTKGKDKSAKKDSSTVNTELAKTGTKQKEPSKGKGDRKKESSLMKDKKDGIKLKQIFAARFIVVLADIHKVKDWILIGTKK